MRQNRLSHRVLIWQYSYSVWWHINSNVSLIARRLEYYWRQYDSYRTKVRYQCKDPLVLLSKVSAPEREQPQNYWTTRPRSFVFPLLIIHMCAHGSPMDGKQNFSLNILLYSYVYVYVYSTWRLHFT